MDLFTPAVPQSLTHIAYLSGLLLAIGLGFWSTIPAIETRGGRFTLLTALVVLGGLARLATAIRLGSWSLGVTGPLVMELGVTPAPLAVAKADRLSPLTPSLSSSGTPSLGGKSSG